MQHAREMAAQRGIDISAMSSSEIVRALQQAEGNEACFDTGESRECGQRGCLWREGCR
jgi:hypothetical protein